MPPDSTASEAIISAEVDTVTLDPAFLLPKVKPVMVTKNADGGMAAPPVVIWTQSPTKEHMPENPTTLLPPTGTVGTAAPKNAGG
jgi:hypothetical protein